ncbi:MULTISPECIES: NFACT family protein [unclassified Thermosipho (in: thermotogales)]|uniref:Rqc2 family fibronectin-binding protein n=1 Tax=unclassified Thermosipho (in: thermotogales) TaxID=2676525 RepID=UPI00098474EE|nr:MULTISPECIES: NFACT family protein [unclassified Thermosipho (in: thermotogales)]MBT1248405.1 fibronectin-binding protein [Thermosipho sp. 1244]OOC47533.1 fibronectin-binding protein [Thermosipho sp. 1223]
MPYDGFVMKRFVDYAREKLLNAHIRNFYYKNNVVYINFQRFDLKVSLNPNFSYITFEKRNLPQDPKRHYFVEYLRSRLRGGIVFDVIDFQFERTLKLVVFKTDEVGEKHVYELYIDIMGKHSNIILVENGLILDAYKRIKNRYRTIYPGEKFIVYKSEKITPYEVKDESDVGMLYKRVQGFSKITVRELMFRMQNTSFNEALKSILNDFEKGCLFLYYENNMPVEISAFPLHHLQISGKRHCDKIEDAINVFFEFKEQKSVLFQMKKNLENVIVKRIIKIENALEKINKELEKAKNYDDYRKYGELLKAYYYEVPKGVDRVELVDWETQETVSVELDKNKNAIENANFYFKKYNKLKVKVKGLMRRKQYLEKELDYLYQLWYTLDEVNEFNELEDIRNEMENVGLVRSKKRKKMCKESEPIKVEYDGYVIYIGKNNKQNDMLVRDSNDEDIWFHASGMPGAHVIIKYAGKEINQDVIEYAASLAAGYSKGKNSGKVPVDYTKAKNVRKTKGLKPGLVLYSNYKTLFVEPRRL